MTHTSETLRATFQHYAGQDTDTVNDAEGYAQMGWDGRFGLDTLCTFVRMGSESVISVRSVRAQYARWGDRLDRFADDMPKQIKEAGRNPYALLHAASTIDAMMGLD